MTTTPEPLSLVVGARGLLGSALVRSLGPDGFPGPPSYPWAAADALAAATEEAVGRLHAAAEAQGRPWAVYWCAGRGHVSAPEPDLAADEASLRTVLDVVGSARPATEGVFCYASSAGAVYAGATAMPASEATPAAPIGGYGESKLRQEAMVTEAVAGAARMRGQLVRISNLYGPGQRAGKPQGLIAHLVLNTLSRTPTTIYVPLDTGRDYLHTRSAARMLTHLGREALAGPAGSTGIRIAAAERTHSISQVIGAVARVLKRRVPFVVAERPETRLQPSLLAFRSLHRRTHLLETVTLEEGLATLVADIRTRQALGR